MKLVCHLRALRGDERTLREIEELTGISRGTLSQYEHGKRLPADTEIPALEQAYGAPAHAWYDAAVLLQLAKDET